MRRKHQYLWVITVQTGAKKICAIEPKRQRIFHKAVAVCWQFVGVFNGNFITTYCILQCFKTKNIEKPGSIWQSHREEYSDTVLTYSGQCLGVFAPRCGPKLVLSVDVKCPTRPITTITNVCSFQLLVTVVSSLRRRLGMETMQVTPLTRTLASSP